MNIDGDHSKAVKNIMAAGINCFVSYGTGKALSLSGHRMKIVKAKTPFRIGTFQVMAFDVNHDAKEPTGFLIQSGKEKLLFATDTFYLKYKFLNLTHIMLECNYSATILEQNIKSGAVHESLRKRIEMSHFSLENVIEFFKANDLSELKEIHLIHLSDTNSNSEIFKTEIQKLTGVPTFIGSSS